MNLDYLKYYTLAIQGSYSSIVEWIRTYFDQSAISNDETFLQFFSKHLEEMFPRYYIHSDKFCIFKFVYVTHRGRVNY